MSRITLSYVETLAFQLPADEQQLLAKHLIDHSSQKLDEKKGPLLREDLYGLWRGKCDEDLDLDQTLYEIRHEWEKELEEIYQ